MVAVHRMTVAFPSMPNTDVTRVLRVLTEVTPSSVHDPGLVELEAATASNAALRGIAISVEAISRAAAAAMASATFEVVLRHAGLADYYPSVFAMTTVAYGES